MTTMSNLAIACITVATIALGAGSAALRAEPCGLVVTQDIVLTGDVSSCAGDGIVIAADGVTLDLNGHTVSGFRAEFSNGIMVDGFNDVTIVNGFVQSFERGVRVQNAHRVVVSGVTSDFNRKAGIFVWNSSEVDLVANTVTINSESGIETLDSDVRLFGNRASSNSLYGIVVQGSGPLETLRLVNNSSRDAGSRAGFLIAGGFTGGTVTLTANRSARHLGYGFQFADGPGVIVDGGGNLVRSNTAGPCFPETACPLLLP